MSGSQTPPDEVASFGADGVAAHNMRIVAFPYYNDNPYLDLLYTDARAKGVRIDKSTSVDDAVGQIHELGHGDLIHLHWTTPICQPFPSAQIALRHTMRFCKSVRTAQRRGARFIWTIHNIYPHELPYPRLESLLTRWILRSADDIIVLTKNTPTVVSEHYRIPPEKVRLLPHCSYVGVYPDEVTDSEARAEFGIDRDDLVLGFLGEQRPYKGIPELLGAFERIRADHPTARLLLGGRARAQDLATISALIDNAEGVTSSGGRVPDGDLQKWLRAADVMVFPYRQILNSGSMFLAATFGRPCVLPANAALVSDWAGEEWIEFYPPGNESADEIHAAVKRIMARWDAAHAAALKFAAQNMPRAMALRFSALAGVVAPATNVRRP